MAITQLSVYLENKPGTLSDVINIMSEAGINIRALSLADTQEFGILRVIVSDVEKTKEILEGTALCVKTQVVAVKMADEAGALNKILTALDKENINIEYMYAFTSTVSGSAYVVFRLDDVVHGEEVLNKNGQVTLSDEDLSEIL